MKKRKSRLEFQAINIIKKRGVAISLLLVITIITIAIVISISGKTQATNEEIEAISDNVNMVKSSDEKWVPVPKGYSASKIPGEDSVDGGFVIYEGEDIDWSFLDENIETSAVNTVSPLEITNDNTYMQNSISNSIDYNLEDIVENVIENSVNTTIEDTESDEVEDELSLENQINQETIAEDIESVAYENYTVQNMKIEDEIEQNEELKEDLSVQNQREEVSDENKLDNIDNEINSLDDEVILGNEVSESIITNTTNNSVISNTNITVDSNLILETNTISESTIIAENENEIQGEEETPTQLEKDIFNLQCSVNQYVWVPIEDVSSIYGKDANGKTWGKIYSFYKSSPNRRPNNWSETDGIINISNLTSYREPDIVTNYDYESNYLKSTLNGITQHEFFQTEMEQFFYQTIESIKKYGGFYIGRYETGGLNGTPVVRKMNTSIDSQTWYTMYKKCKRLGDGKEAVTTSMIWGTLWDETLEWFMKSGAIINNGNQMTYSLICSDSTTWGNYYNASFNYYKNLDMLIGEKKLSTRTKIPTGSAEYTKVNNIYDMAGNVFDWTLEAYSSNYRVCRGGGYINYGSDYPASYRYDYVPNYNSNYIRLSSPTFN